MFGVSAAHGNESEEQETNTQDQLSNGEPELGLSVCSHGENVECGVNGDLNAKRDSRRVVISPEMDHSIDSRSQMECTNFPSTKS